MPSKRTETIARVRRRLDAAACFIHGHGLIAPGQFTEAISVDEARRRADFEVVDVPIAPDADDPMPATSEKEDV